MSEHRSMAMPMEEWNNFLSQPGAYLYHTTHRDNLPSIMQHGIMPRDQAMNAGMEGRFFNWGDASQPRPGHVYLSTHPKSGWTDGDNDVTFAIPAKHLDPSLISMDEDNIPLNGPISIPNAQGRPFGDWVEQNHGDYLNDPQNTLKSWNKGTVAYRGTIPPEHFRVIGQPQQQVAAVSPQGDWVYGSALEPTAAVEHHSGADHDGAMVAIYLPKDAQDKLHQPGGEPKKDLHITLVYFEDKAADRDDWDKAQRIAEEVAHTFGSMDITIGGLGFFDPKDSDEHPVIGTVDAPGLAELHLALKDALNAEGFQISDAHGFVPHVTLEYKAEENGPDAEDKKLPKIDLPVSFQASDITFCVQNKQTKLPLEGDHHLSTRNPRVAHNHAESPVRIVTANGEVKVAQGGQNSQWTGETASDGRLILYRGISLTRNQGAALQRDPSMLEQLLRDEGHTHWSDTYRMAEEMGTQDGRLPGIIIEGLVNPQDVIAGNSPEYADLVHNRGVFVPGTAMWNQEREFPVRQGAQVEVANITFVNYDEQEDLPGPRMVTAGNWQDKYHYQKATGSKSCGSCAAFKAGRCEMFKAPVESDSVCDEWTDTWPEKKKTSAQQVMYHVAAADLSAVIQEFMQNPSVQALATPEGSFDKCKTTAMEFARFAQQQGLPAQVVNLSGAQGYDRHQMVPQWNAFAGGEIHYAVQIGDQIVDFAARQFDPGADFPEIVPVDEYRARWESAYDVPDDPRYKLGAASVMYHVAPRSARESILANGLDNSQFGYDEMEPDRGGPGAYLWDNIENAQKYQRMYGGDLYEVNHPELELSADKYFEPDYRPDYWDILKPENQQEIVQKAEQNRQQWMRGDQPPGAWYSRQPISPNRLRLLSDERTAGWHEAESGTTLASVKESDWEEQPELRPGHRVLWNGAGHTVTNAGQDDIHNRLNPHLMPPAGHAELRPDQPTERHVEYGNDRVIAPLHELERLPDYAAGDRVSGSSNDNPYWHGTIVGIRNEDPRSVKIQDALAVNPDAPQTYDPTYMVRWDNHGLAPQHPASLRMVEPGGEMPADPEGSPDTFPESWLSRTAHNIGKGKYKTTLKDHLDSLNQHGDYHARRKKFHTTLSEHLRRSKPMGRVIPFKRHKRGSEGDTEPGEDDLFGWDPQQGVMRQFAPGEMGAGVGYTIWRGLWLGLHTQEEIAQIQANPKPWIMQKLNTEDVGAHWTEDEKVAHQFALNEEEPWESGMKWRELDEDEPDKFDVGIVLAAEVPQDQHILNPDNEDEWHAERGITEGVYTMDESESEVTIRPGSPINFQGAQLVWEDIYGENQGQMPLNLAGMQMTAAGGWVPTEGDGNNFTFSVGDRVRLPQGEMGTIIEVEPPAPDDYDDDGEPVGETIMTRVKLDSGQVVRAPTNTLMFVQGMEPAPARPPATRETHPGPDSPEEIAQMIHDASLRPPAGFEQYHHPIPREQWPARFYHVAPQEARDSIMREGLDATDRTQNWGFDPGEGGWTADEGAHMVEDDNGDLLEHEWRPEGIYMWGDENHAHDYAPYAPVQGELWPPDVWEIDPQHLNEVLRDPSAINWEADQTPSYFTERVPPQALRLMPPRERYGSAPQDWHETPPNPEHRVSLGAIDPDWLSKYIEHHGPYLYHTTSPEAVPYILNEGLYPWDASDYDPDDDVNWGNDYSQRAEDNLGPLVRNEHGIVINRPNSVYAGERTQPRSGRTYMGDLVTARKYGVPYVQIDLRKLDPERIGSDEDHFDEQNRWGAPIRVQDAATTLGLDPMSVESSPPSWDDPEIWLDPDVDTLGDWADKHAHILDHPQITPLSLHHGSVSYDGMIPPEALSLNDTYRGEFPELAPKQQGLVARVVDKVKGAFKKGAIDPDYLQRWMELNGPYMYHQTDPEAIPLIMRHGLLPRATLGHEGQYHGWLLSRPNHVYLQRPREHEIPLTQPWLRVDLSKLDPENIDADEDLLTHLQHSVAPEHDHPILRDLQQQGVPVLNDYAEARSTDPSGWLRKDPAAEPYTSLGHLADIHSDVMDHPETVAHSLGKLGNVAVRGGIPPEAISINPPALARPPYNGMVQFHLQNPDGEGGTNYRWHPETDTFYRQPVSYQRYLRDAVHGDMEPISYKDWIDAASGWQHSNVGQLPEWMRAASATNGLHDWTEKQAGTEYITQPYYYHAAPTTERQRIMMHGLQPSRPGYSENWKAPDYLLSQPEGVYVTKGKQGMSPEVDVPTDIWRVPADQIKDMQPDPYLDPRGEYNHYFVIPHPVMPELHRPYEERNWGDEDVHADPVTQDWWWEEMPNEEKRKQMGIGFPDRVIGKTAADDKSPAEDQDAQKALQKATELVNLLGQGGFTATSELDPVTPDMWMVAVAGTTIRRLMNSLGVNDILQKAQELVAQDPSLYLGGWKEFLKDEGETGYGCIEISAGIPDLEQAKQHAKANGQDAIYHPVLERELVYDAKLQDYVDRKEAAMGTDNPRFKRYHNMVSAPELWNAEAVAKALAILNGQEEWVEDEQSPSEEQESDEDGLAQVIPFPSFLSPQNGLQPVMVASTTDDWS